MSVDEKVNEVYEYIQRKIAEGLSPTVREIARDLNIRSTSTVHRYIAELVERGYIEKGQGQNRSLRLKAQTGATPVPVIGRVAAGIPITAVENIEEYVMFGGRYDPKELFALRVQGESMKNAGIMDGDLVIVRHIAAAENGQIVVAMIDGEATVKRFYRRGAQFELRPENEAFEPIVTKQLSVLGPVVGVLRYY